MTRADPNPAPRRRAQARGMWAEWLAAGLLMLRGYRILARRARTSLGEIDLIARRGRVVVFVEVKYRRRSEQFAAALTARQGERIGRAARLFLARRPDLAGCDLRFDVIWVYDKKLPQYIKNYWQPSQK